MRYVVAKAYDVGYAQRLIGLYARLYEHVLEWETSHYWVNTTEHVEVRLYVPEFTPFILYDVRKQLQDLHVIYGHGNRLEIL